MNYYEILEIRQGATDREIKVAYRRLAKLNHPDVNPQGEAKFKQIQEAYETLSVERKRALYDLNLLMDGLGGSGFRRPSPGFRTDPYFDWRPPPKPQPKTMTFKATSLRHRGRNYINQNDVVRNLREAAIFFKEDSRTTQEILSMLADTFEEMR